MSQEPWREQFLDGLRCPICNGTFRLVHLMAKPNRPLRAIVRCSECGQVGIGTVKIAGQVHPLVEHISSTPVTETDVTDMRDFLDSFDGNFQKLLS